MALPLKEEQKKKSKKKKKTKNIDSQPTFV
jgi:hypothetical protein